MAPSKKKRKATRRSTRLMEQEAAAMALQNPALGRLDDELLKEKLFPFLSTNDVTTLSMACLGMYEKVTSFRRSHGSPSLVWETVQPTKIGYDYKMRRPDLTVTTYQIQRFFFVLRNESGETVEVELSLENAVWDETLNSRIYFDPPTHYPKRTVPKIAVIRPKLGTQTRKRLFVASPGFGSGNQEDSYLCFLGEDGGDNDYIEEDRADRSEQDKKELREAMQYILICARRIAAFPNGTTYPSAEYLLRTLPNWLHQYFPATFDWNADHTDRETVVEFDYRPAQTLAEWEAKVPHQWDGIYAYDP